MRIKLAYGKTGLSIDLDDAWKVTLIEPRHIPGLANAAGALAAALRFSVGGVAFKPFYETYGRYSVYLNVTLK